MHQALTRTARTKIRQGILLLACALGSAQASALEAPVTRLALSQAIEAALHHYPDLGVAQAAIDEARAQLVQAQARPNPELELLTGRIHARRDAGAPGPQYLLNLAQPLEWPEAREARQESARQEIVAAEAQASQARAELIHQVKLAYIHVLSTEESLRLAEEDQQHILGVRDRVKAMVGVGEAPRYEAVKAEAEALAATRQVETARHQLQAARGILANLTGSSGNATGPLDAPLPEQVDMATLRLGMEQTNPRYARARAAVAAARARVGEARADRIPPPTLKAGLERYPDSDAWTVGLAMPIPLLDQRQGQVAAAEARLDRALAEGRLDMLMIERELEQGYHRYRSARAQLQAIEGGLLAEAQDALRVAETAYRAGERGILDVLDARRTLRAVRLDRIQALFDTYAALFDLERLSGTELLRVTP